MTIKKSISVISAVSLAALILSGCSTGGDSGDGDNETVVVYAAKAEAENATRVAVDTAFTKETGIEVEYRIVPGEVGDEAQKNLDIALLNGDDGDVVFMGNNTGMSKYADSGLLLPLDDYIEASGDDVEAKYGDNLSSAIDPDGAITGLPSESNIWGVYYNKKIFDDAGVPYPSGAWTWDDYIETAQKLTDVDKGIYGSYMLDYDNYYFGYASQHEVSAYKDDKTVSNYDDPAFADALQFYGDLGTVYGIQPSYLDFTSKGLTWDGFMTGQYGMTFISSWYLSMFANADYPRDWEFGITQTPTPADADNRVNLAATGYFGVVANGHNHDAAYEYVKFQADEGYKYNGRLPARVDLSDDDWNTVFADTVKNSGDNVTVKEVTDALVNNDMTVVSEKIIGPAAAEYSAIILQHGQLYLLGEKSLDDAVTAIKTDADKAIEAALKAN